MNMIKHIFLIRGRSLPVLLSKLFSECGPKIGVIICFEDSFCSRLATLFKFLNLGFHSILS